MIIPAFLIKPLLIAGSSLVLAVGGYFYISHKWNERLEEGISIGRAQVEGWYEQENNRIIREADRVAQENARELLGVLGKQRVIRETIYEQIPTVITEHITHFNECKPPPSYLVVWDQLTEDRSRELLPARGSNTSEVREPSTSSPNS